jgi:valyl-tRNA synthetase
VEAEKAKLNKELADINKWIAGTAGKLKNERFVANAPEQVVANARAQLAELEERKVRTEELLATLG